MYQMLLTAMSHLNNTCAILSGRKEIKSAQRSDT